MFLQRTIRKDVTVHGVGLHTGKGAQLVFRPAPPDTGIYFVRRDLPGDPAIQVHASRVQATSLATVLGGESFSVSTVEHCLSSLSALRIDNLFIDLYGPEIPIVDGSALPFLKALQSVGMVEQDHPRKYCSITEPVYFSEGDKTAYVVPYNGLKLSVSIDFPHPAIGHQVLELDINEKTFEAEIAPARTFGFLKEVEALRDRGLALGGSLENAIVLDEEKVLNPEGLRFKDEFVRHKALDALGDLVTLGFPLMGHLILHKHGHDIMNKLVKFILQSPGSCSMMELGSAIPSSQELNPQSFWATKNKL